MTMEFGSANMLTYRDIDWSTKMTLTFPLSIKVVALIVEIFETKPIEKKVIILRNLHIYHPIKTHANSNLPEILTKK